MPLVTNSCGELKTENLKIHLGTQKGLMDFRDRETQGGFILLKSSMKGFHWDCEMKDAEDFSLNYWREGWGSQIRYLALTKGSCFHCVLVKPHFRLKTKNWNTVRYVTQFLLCPAAWGHCWTWSFRWQVLTLSSPTLPGLCLSMPLVPGRPFVWRARGPFLSSRSIKTLSFTTEIFADSPSFVYL